MNQDDGLPQGDLFDPELIPTHLAITAMRDSGYKNTAYALAELIDNAVQAEASTIEVFCIEKREQVRKRERSRLSEVAVLDNGSGMNLTTLWMALQFGNGTRLNDRTGIGRFGMGLPNASISQARRTEVWSWRNGPGNAMRSYIDLEEIENGRMKNVPEPEHIPLPERWKRLSMDLGLHGTLVVWSNLDFERLTWKSSKSTLQHTEEIVGRVYRRFILDGRVRIRLCAMEDGAEDIPIFDRDTSANDPLYLVPVEALPAPFDTEPMFTHVFDDSHDIEYKGRVHTVRARYAVASEDTIIKAGTANRGDTKYGNHAKKNIGVSVLRAGREIMLDPGWCIGYDPRERWWGGEVEFPPHLDELFGVTNNKQAATHFAEMANTEFEELAEEGEEFIDVVKRLKEDGDPRGWLLGLSDSIQRNLQQLRKIIKGQGVGGRSSKGTRHDVDDATKTVNVGWKQRSKDLPLEEDEKKPTESDLDEIRADLTKNKKYSHSEAEELVSLIRDADLKVVFLEADFPDAFQLFNVDMKGHITEITFNRNHPAFDDIFGTIATADEDVEEFSKEEVIERLTRAVNAGKIIFAAWGRYEREAGIERAKALRKVRFDWSQIAAKFLDPDDGLL